MPGLAKEKYQDELMIFQVEEALRKVEIFLKEKDRNSKNKIIEGSEHVLIENVEELEYLPLENTEKEVD